MRRTPLIAVKAFANADDVLIAWEPNPWNDAWVGFQLERRNETTKQVTMLSNRIPPQAGQGPVQPTGISSAQSPIRRCIWTDHSAVVTDSVAYRVTAMTASPGGAFLADVASASDWTQPTVVSGDAGNGLEAYFNRGILMSQFVSRFVNGNVTEASLRAFLQNLATPGFQARLYLAGDALKEILTFLHEADRRSSTVHAAIYEINDHELVDALKPFGSRGHILIGNGGATQPWVAQQLQAAGLEVKHRDLSNGRGTSPSVHNKFVVESTSPAQGMRVLTGSTNWTTSGLCTQLNNVLIVEDATIATRFLTQWNLLVADGNSMPPALKTSNSTPTNKGEVALYFAATNNEAEFKPVLELIAGAKQGALFLMFMPGQSPLLEALLDRVRRNDIYVRGVVSTVTTSKNGDIGTVGGQVVKSGAPAQAFHDDVTLPAGVTAGNDPSWAETEFNVQEIRGAGLIAIVHSKAIVIDPFSDDCAVITGSHNFSVSASQKNDENLVIVRGNKKLAQAYAVNINGAYDHYSWRAYLASGGDPDQIYKPLDGWKPGGSRAQELAFWMNEPIPPQKSAAAAGTAPRASSGQIAKGSKKAGPPVRSGKSAPRPSEHKTVKGARGKPKAAQKKTSARKKK